MNEMSDEQRVVMNYIRDGDNVLVDACAGSGKSTTILSTAQALPDKKFLQLTYNSMLRHEIKGKINELKLKNLQVHTYHSLAVRYYLTTAHTDTGIRYILCNKLEPREKIPPFDVLVLDETQDMTFLYYQFMVKLTKDMGGQIQMLILGDYMQGLYEFKGADTRFLTQGDQLWAINPRLTRAVFHKCTLKMSYRITKQMAKFVNQTMLGDIRLEACREGGPVVYIRRSRHQIEQIVVYQIRRLLAEGESPNDIFVLGASVKGANSNIRRMENVLVENDIPCHVPMTESDAIDERVISGKVVFSTFHTVKGRQRKYVFVVGFDNNYLTYYARNLPKNQCPNTLYVGCTRATHGLFLLENDQSRPLEFLKKTHHEMKQCDYIDFKGMPQTIFHDKEVDMEMCGVVLIPTHHITPTELIKFVPESVIEEISPILDRIFITEQGIIPEDEIDIPKVLNTRRGYYEDVSDLNGIAIPSIYYDYLEGGTKGANILTQMIHSVIQEMKENEHIYLKRIVRDLPEKCETIDDYLYLANVYVAVQEKLYFKLKQIERDEYGWLTAEMVARCRSRLDGTVGKECKDKSIEVEKQLIHHSMELEHTKIDALLYQYFSYEIRFRFSARADLITDDTLWELKCTSKISIDHLMQVVIYAWLWRMTCTPEQEKKPCKILNIRTGEQLRLNATTEELTQIVVALLRGKYGKPVILEDDDFVNNCQEYSKNLFAQ